MIEKLNSIVFHKKKREYIYITSLKSKENPSLSLLFAISLFTHANTPPLTSSSNSSTHIAEVGGGGPRPRRLLRTAAQQFPTIPGN